MWESRVLRRAFERLELHEGKLSRAVLRGGGGGDVTSLPDTWVGNHPGLPGPRTPGEPIGNRQGCKQPERQKHAQNQEPELEPLAGGVPHQISTVMPVLYPPFRNGSQRMSLLSALSRELAARRPADHCSMSSPSDSSGRLRMRVSAGGSRAASSASMLANGRSPM